MIATLVPMALAPDHRNEFGSDAFQRPYSSDGDPVRSFQLAHSQRVSYSAYGSLNFSSLTGHWPSKFAVSLKKTSKGNSSNRADAEESSTSN
jgi:hypothetical protein